MVYKIFLAIAPEASEFFAPLIQTLSILAIIYGSLTTCRQVDLKPYNSLFVCCPYGFSYFRDI